jgi:hypothetical protein
MLLARRHDLLLGFHYGRIQLIQRGQMTTASPQAQMVLSVFSPIVSSNVSDAGNHLISLAYRLTEALLYIVAIMRRV